MFSSAILLPTCQHPSRQDYPNIWGSDGYAALPTFRTLELQSCSALQLSCRPAKTSAHRIPQTPGAAMVTLPWPRSRRVNCRVVQLCNSTGLLSARGDRMSGSSDSSGLLDQGSRGGLAGRERRHIAYRKGQEGEEGMGDLWKWAYQVGTEALEVLLPRPLPSAGCTIPCPSAGRRQVCGAAAHWVRGDLAPGSSYPDSGARAFARHSGLLPAGAGQVRGRRATSTVRQTHRALSLSKGRGL